MDSDSATTTSSEISMNEFLEFLKITCQVNDSIMNINRTPGHEIDYNQLAKNEIVNSLLGSVLKENSEIGAAVSGAAVATVNTSAASTSTTAAGDDDLKNPDKIKSGKIRGKFSTTTTLATVAKPSKGKIIEGFPHKGIHPVLSAKLDEVINEGILDSVLPFICPQASKSTSSGDTSMVSTKSNKSNKIRDTSPNMSLKPTTSSFLGKEAEKKDTTEYEVVPYAIRSPRFSEGTIKLKEPKVPRRKSIANLPNYTKDEKKSDVEVVIHVCDEVKNLSKDFSCPQSLLVTKMGYFADVTAGQKLEDMDISVHCDIQIFEWLMKWVKRDPDQSDTWPQLDATNVVPILVSASFLQMEPLLLDCLSFCHSRLNEVVRASANLSCLNDSIITRLAAMFTNIELEMVKDKKERVTPRLWTKMIQSLCEPEPQALRGHYFTLAGLFRCTKCGKFLTQSVSSYISCIPSNNRLNRWGQLVSQHLRDSSFQITNYVAALFKELKSWRKVYWKLWGHAHFLYCCICEAHFPAYQMNWCQYHPEAAQFLGPATEGRMAGPTGRYPCCGQQTFRFETLPGPNGCQFREHSVIVECDRDKAILTLAQIAADGNCLFEPPPPPKPQTSVQGSQQQEPRWQGMLLMPIKCRQGLLPTLHVEEHNKLSRRIRAGAAAACAIESSSETDSSVSNDHRKYYNRELSSSSDGCESEIDSPKPARGKANRRMIRNGRYWCGEMSARSNQDHQREFEEKVMKQVIAMVNKKTGIDNSVSHNNNHHIGGSYVRLEAEWKEYVKQKNQSKQKQNKEK